MYSDAKKKGLCTAGLPVHKVPNPEDGLRVEGIPILEGIEQMRKICAEVLLHFRSKKI